MDKFRQTFNGTIKYKVSADCMLSQYELRVLRRQPIGGLVQIGSGKEDELIYLCRGKRTLAQELQGEFTVLKMRDLLTQLLHITQELDARKLRKEKIVLSPNLIFIEPGDSGYQFLYVPVNGDDGVYSILLFARDIILRAAAGDESAYRKWDQWSETLEGALDIQRALKTMPGSGRSADIAHKAKKKEILERQDWDFEAETDLEGGFSEDLPDDEAGTDLSDEDDYYVPVSNGPVNEDDEACTDMEDDPVTEGETSLDDSDDYFSADDEPTGIDDEDMGVFDEEEWGRGRKKDPGDLMDKTDGTYIYDSLSQVNKSTGSQATLIRLATGESWRIDSDVFRIGRSTQRTDMCITGNTSVSGIHAMIQRRNGKYYLQDCHSTNGTYLNGERLTPNTEPVQLSNGDIIRLWKEEIVFTL